MTRNRRLAFAVVVALSLSSCALQSRTPERAIFLLAGQSNMSGRGELENATIDALEGVWVFGNDNAWQPARHPVDSSDGQIDRVSNDGDKPGVGLAISFANKIVREMNTEIGLVPCAKGGTSIVEWLPPQKGSRTASLFGNCISRAAAASDRGRLVGALYYQGETDARTLVTAEHWDSLFAIFVDALRHSVDNASLPIVFAQIGSVSDEQRKTYVYWDEVQVSQARTYVPCAVMVTTDDLPLKPDGLHLSSIAQEQLGERFARAFLDLLTKSAGGTCK